jgi:hypothetical protein
LPSAYGSNVVLAGEWNYRRTICLLKFNSAGQLLWGQKNGGCYECIETDVFSVAVDSAQNVYAGGIIENSAPLLAKHDSSGHLLWCLGLGYQVFDLAISGTNLFAVGNFSQLCFNAGYCYNTANCGFTMSPTGGRDGFLARLDLNGQILEANKIGGSSNDSVLALALDKAGNACVTGYFRGSATFGTQTLTSAGVQDLFVARLQTSQAELHSSLSNGQLRLSWPILSDGFDVETTDDLTIPFSKSNLAVQTNVAEFFVTTPASAPAQKFFRLRRP